MFWRREGSEGVELEEALGWLSCGRKRGACALESVYRSCWNVPRFQCRSRERVGGRERRRSFTDREDSRATEERGSNMSRGQRGEFHESVWQEIQLVAQGYRWRCNRLRRWERLEDGCKNVSSKLLPSTRSHNSCLHVLSSDSVSSLAREGKYLRGESETSSVSLSISDFEAVANPSYRFQNAFVLSKPRERRPCWPIGRERRGKLPFRRRRLL